MEIKGLIFDLDGVLIDTAKYHFRSWIKLADTLGFTLNDKIEEQLKGISRMNSLEIVLKQGNITCSEEEKIKMAAQKNDWYLESLSDVDDKVILDGVIPFIEYSAAKNIPMAVGSASKNASFLLEKLGMTHYFKSIVDGNMVRKTKPDPEVFINAARNLQLREEHCMIFEDSNKGIQAALTGGFQVIGIGKRENLAEAHEVIPSFVGHNYDSVVALLN